MGTHQKSKVLSPSGISFLSSSCSWQALLCASQLRQAKQKMHEKVFQMLWMMKPALTWLCQGKQGKPSAEGKTNQREGKERKGTKEGKERNQSKIRKKEEMERK